MKVVFMVVFALMFILSSCAGETQMPAGESGATETGVQIRLKKPRQRKWKKPLRLHL